MAGRAIYLTVSNRTSRQRGHFAIFIPNEPAADLSIDDDLAKTKGTIIQVVGEPVMQGYKLEFKRNCDCETAHPVQKLVPLGYVDGKDVTGLSIDIEEQGFSTDSTPRSSLERVAAQIPPPPRGQDARAPINGVSACKRYFDVARRSDGDVLQVTTKRCQEWTMEYVERLKDQGLVSPGAPEGVSAERDPPTRSIFGHKGGSDNE